MTAREFGAGGELFLGGEIRQRIAGRSVNFVGEIVGQEGNLVRNIRGDQRPSVRTDLLRLFAVLAISDDGCLDTLIKRRLARLDVGNVGQHIGDRDRCFRTQCRRPVVDDS